jgi:hydroxylamine reductase (hybrid-cluster protein)
MGTGCTLKGVCGKTSEVANLQDLLLFVVRGIAVYQLAVPFGHLMKAVMYKSL